MTAPPTMSRTDPPPAPPTPPRLGISLTQVVATALAAITATVVASLFGVTGTVVGAAVSSVLSVVGTAVYGHSLRRTQQRVRDVVPVAARRAPTPPHRPGSETGTDRAPYAPTFPGTPGNTSPPGSTSAGYGPARYSSGRPRRTLGVRRSLGLRLALGCAGLFAAILAVVTAVEVVAQRPLSDLVRGDTGVSGTTLFGSHHRTQTNAPQPAPTAPQQRRPGPTVTRTVTSTPVPSTSVPRSTPTSPTSAPTSTTAAPSTPAASRAAADRSGGTAPLG